MSPYDLTMSITNHNITLVMTQKGTLKTFGNYFRLYQSMCIYSSCVQNVWPSMASKRVKERENKNNINIETTIKNILKALQGKILCVRRVYIIIILKIIGQNINGGEKPTKMYIIILYVVVEVSTYLLRSFSILYGSTTILCLTVIGVPIILCEVLPIPR